MKKYIIFPILILLIYMSGSVFAQNFTKEIAVPDDNSIIRQVNISKWLTYSSGEKGMAFYMVPETGTNIQYLSLSDKQIEVLDFEILSDTVFFCGKRTENGTSDASTR